MSTVQLKNIKKVYPFSGGDTKRPKKEKKGGTAPEKKNNLQITDEGVVAVQEFSLDIADKEFIVLVGPSGCGKSTTLRMVAGLEEISGGELYIDGELVNHVAPKDRDIAMVFQNYALYPHMTVYKNMAFSLSLKHLPKDEIDRKVREAAEILDITEYLNRKPKALSGGQRQRVAIGRAIVRAPKVMLMDEPLSNLDAKLRNEMRAEIIKLRKRIDTTFIYVTHDQTEAMTLGDRIVVMKDGFIQQIGTPQEVFSHPANLFVAGFIGMPVMNFFDAELTEERTFRGKGSPPESPRRPVPVRHAGRAAGACGSGGRRRRRYRGRQRNDGLFRPSAPDRAGPQHDHDRPDREHGGHPFHGPDGAFQLHRRRRPRLQQGDGREPGVLRRTPDGSEAPCGGLFDFRVSFCASRRRFAEFPLTLQRKNCIILMKNIG